MSINLEALAGRDGLNVGDRVLIGGSGAHAGEVAVIERILKSVIPSAIIRTASGERRQARTIDLTPAGEGSQATGTGPASGSPATPGPSSDEDASQA